jgi:hypothetical protein
MYCGETKHELIEDHDTATMFDLRDKVTVEKENCLATYEPSLAQVVM